MVQSDDSIVEEEDDTENTASNAHEAAQSRKYVGVDRLRRRSSQRTPLFADIPLHHRDYFQNFPAASSDGLSGENKYKWVVNHCSLL